MSQFFTLTSLILKSCHDLPCDIRRLFDHQLHKPTTREQLVLSESVNHFELRVESQLSETIVIVLIKLIGVSVNN